jgi:very-short-patch-repair endonuclease
MRPQSLSVDLIALNWIASRQRGLFTRRQARDCGLSSFQLRQRVRSGMWRRVAPSVFAPTTLTITAAVRDRAVQLATPGSVLAGPSAARCWDLPVPDARPCLLVAPHAHPRVDALVIYETLDRSDLWIGDGVPVTSRPRTVVDCLRLLPYRDALTLVERALQQNWISLEELSRRTRGLVGRRGTPGLVRLVRTVADGSRSAAERRLVKLLGDAGIVGWAVNVAIRDQYGLIGVGDIVFAERRVVIEVDGWAFHVAPDRFQRDRERQNRLVAAGWTVLRFTWRDLTDRPDSVVATVRAVLR